MSAVMVVVIALKPRFSLGRCNSSYDEIAKSFCVILSYAYGYQNKAYFGIL